MGDDVEKLKGAGGQQVVGFLSEGFSLAPGAVDPFSALILQEMGFSHIYLGGNAMGTQIGIGQPMVTMTEAVDCASRITRVLDLPLIADAGAGFGDPAHTHRTVREFERAGVAAVHIDDQPAPKRAHYHRGSGRVIPIDEYVDKLEVAVGARQQRMSVIGKTDALRLMSLEETIQRCHRIVGAGVDALLIVDLDPDQARVVRAEFPDTPLVWLGGHKGPVPDARSIEDGGFALALYPFSTLAAVSKAIRECWSGVLSGGRPALSDESVLSQYRSYTLDLVHMETYWEIEERTTERQR